MNFPIKNHWNSKSDFIFSLKTKKPLGHEPYCVVAGVPVPHGGQTSSAISSGLSSCGPLTFTHNRKKTISQKAWSVLPWYLRVAFNNRCCKQRDAPALTLVAEACQAAALSKLYPA